MPKTNTEKLRERRIVLASVAQAFGFKSWSGFETFVKANSHRPIQVTIGAGKRAIVYRYRPSRAVQATAR